MPDEKKTIVQLQIKRAPADSDAFFRDPEALKKHMNAVAALDAAQNHNNPDKPATRVSSLDSFLTSSTQSSFSMKPSGSLSSVVGISETNVKPFAKSEPDKSRKK